MAKVKTGRWVYCKYCHKNVRPIINYSEEIIMCPECGYGLAPIKDVIRAGSYDNWLVEITERFLDDNRILIAKLKEEGKL